VCPNDDTEASSRAAPADWRTYQRLCIAAEDAQRRPYSPWLLRFIASGLKGRCGKERVLL
jgi:hypothetical protein